MALPGFDPIDPPKDGECSSNRQRWSCSQMRRDPKDKDMQYELYRCIKCGAIEWLDYDEMR